MKKSPLTEYRYSKSGDMRGSHYSEIIRRYDDTRALYSISSSSWYGGEDTVTEYFLDTGVLSELETIFRKYHMRSWQRRKISRMFIADGASKSYQFTFGADTCGFSSQMYPGAYGCKVQKLCDVIERYAKDCEKLPGLVLPAADEENDPPEEKDRPEPGKLSFSVIRYCGGKLTCRVKNGTAEPVSVAPDFHVTDLANGGEIPVTRSEYEWEWQVKEDQVIERDVTVTSRLAPGTYRLDAGAFRAEFEIR